MPEVRQLAAKRAKMNYHSESTVADEESRSFQFEQQAVKKWHLAVAYSLIWLVVSATFIVLYGVDITTGTISQKFFTLLRQEALWLLT